MEMLLKDIEYIYQQIKKYLFYLQIHGNYL